MRRVLVTDAGRGSSIAIIRSLGRRGYHVVAADSDPASPGLRSRHVRERVIYPAPASEPEEAASVLLRAATESRIDLLIPVTDVVIFALADIRERFADVCTLAMAEPAALAAAADKVATFELARELGVPVPRAVVVSTAEEAVAAAPELGWPVVIKPERSRLYRDGEIESFGVRYADSAEELRAEVGRLESKCVALLQEYVPGEGHGVELLLDRGRPLAAFQHRRLHEVPLTGGASSLRESVPLDPVLYEHSTRLLAEMEWTGLAMVEFKVGPDGPSLMEINGRIWGSLPLAVKSGVDFPALLADLYLSGPPAADVRPQTDYRVGVRSRNLELEVVWIASVLRGKRRRSFQPPPRREALEAALRLFSPADGFDIISRDDPRPGLAEIAKIVRKLPGKLARAG